MQELEKRLKEISEIKNLYLYPPFPKKNLLIEITNRCNCNCIFCANGKMKRKRGNIDFNLAVKILKEAYQLGTREVGFYTTGESLLDENLSRYIKIAKEIGYEYVYITTNGILLNDKNIHELSASGIDSIKLSINAINSSDYKFIHGIDCYEKVMNNLKKLYEFRSENNLNFKIYVSYVATKYTDYDIDIIKKNFSKFSDEVAIISVRNQSGLMPEVLKYLECSDKENKIQSERLLPCHYVFDTINVSYEGYLTACCSDFENYLAYADLNKESLEDAWHNEIITELRKKHLNKDLGKCLCSNCIYSGLEIPVPLNSDYCTKLTEKTFHNNKVYTRIKNNKKI